MKIKKYFVVLFFIAFYINDSKAQVIVNPIFDRSDEPLFRIEKVEITPDTTYISCSYHAEEGSWACLYDKTYLEYTENGTRLPIIKVTGLPLYPNQKYFSRAEDVQVVLYFPHICANKINLIENDDNESFNIYGIDLKKSYDCYYSVNDVEMFFNSAMANEKTGNWMSAINDLLKQLEASKYVFGIRSREVSWPMFTLTNQYGQLGEYEKMIEWGKQAINILCELPQDSINLDVLARSYGNVGTAYALLHQLDVAEQYMELSLATRRIKEGVGTLNYEEYLGEIAKKNYYEGNYPKALLYRKEITEIYERKYQENNYRYGCAYVNSLNNLYESYRKMDQNEEATRVAIKTMTLLDEGWCQDVTLQKQSALNIANELLNMGKIDESINCIKMIVDILEGTQTTYDKVDVNARILMADILLESKQDTVNAIKIYESVLKTIEEEMLIGNHRYPEQINILFKLYKTFLYKDKEVGMQYLKKAIQTQKEWLGEESVTYANLLLELVINTLVESISIHDTDSLYYYLQHSSEIIKRHFNNSIYNMSKTEREKYWERYKYIFTWLIPTICGLYDTEAGNSLAYDAALFYKGMLLSSEREFKNTIQNSNDDKLKRLYQDYTYHLTELEKQYSISSTDNTVDSLKNLIHDEEFILSQNVTWFNRQYKGTDFSWEEVKRQLDKEDVAIEIISYEGVDGQNVYYDAYVINSESESPQLISLCSEDKLKSFINDSIDYKGLSMLFWGNKKIHDAIKDAKNIYFSAAGLFNTIGIEYLPIAGNRYIYDRFNLYRLSSTRELCLKTDTKRIDNAYLYGGLDYNIYTEQTMDIKTIPNRLSRSAVEALAHRGGFDLLIGSLQEVEQIKSTLSKHKIKCVLLSGSAGTEESIKNLSGSHLGILHLSTHGMYIPDNSDSIKNANNYRFIISEEVPYVDDEEISLSHSFLVMSGGNALIHRDSIPLESEDGILTALEISHFDLSNLDLVVLSACETGLGEVNFEGVYGLQRAFKKAGANTILMSLGKVDDEATRILMVEFYRNLMDGKTKRESLLKAQQYLRKVGNGKYDDPKYWASFIMLDGLN